MLNIAIVIVHNKTDQENYDQIETLKQHITLATDQNDGFESYHYTLNGLDIPHVVRLFQIIPYGGIEPSNFYDIDSHNVIYRAGDEDKTGDNPRFFNWGLKRGTDYGADIVFQLTDVADFDIVSTITAIKRVYDHKNDVELINTDNGTITSAVVLDTVGQLDEEKPIDQSFGDFTTAIQETGMIVEDQTNG